MRDALVRAHGGDYPFNHVLIRAVPCVCFGPLATAHAQLLKKLDDALLVDVVVGNVHAKEEGDDERPNVEVKTPGTLERCAFEHLQRNLGLAPLGVDEVVPMVTKN